MDHTKFTPTLTCRGPRNSQKFFRTLTNKFLHDASDVGCVVQYGIYDRSCLCYSYAVLCSSCYLLQTVSYHEWNLEDYNDVSSWLESGRKGVHIDLYWGNLSKNFHLDNCGRMDESFLQRKLIRETTDGNRWRSCPIAGLGITSAKPSSSAAKSSVNLVINTTETQGICGVFMCYSWEKSRGYKRGRSIGCNRKKHVSLFLSWIRMR
jgi:hypothetical protein